MKTEFNIKLNRQQVIMICNVLAVKEDGQPQQYRIGAGKIVFDILEILNPLVAEPVKEAELPIDTNPAPIGVEADTLPSPSKEEITS